MHTRTIITSFRRGSEYILSRTPGIRTLYWRLCPLIYRWSRLRRVDHVAPLEPFRLRWINPEEISQFTGREGAISNRWRDIGTVQGGDWDTKSSTSGLSKRTEYLQGVFTAETIEETVLYQSFRAHFMNGVEWTETELFQRLLIVVENGCEIWRGSRTAADLLERCNELDQLYANIKENGYKAQMDLLKDGGLKRDRVGYLDVLTDEVCLDIGRDGELLFVDGRHRLAIAKILELNRIPFVVLVRHKDWIQKRDRLYCENISGEYFNHPDLAELRSINSADKVRSNSSEGSQP